MRTRSGRVTAWLSLVVILMAALPGPTAWAVSDGTWTQLAPVGVPPSERFEVTLVHDTARDRVVARGTVWGADYIELWALLLGEPPGWEQLAFAGTVPAARFGDVAIYDPVGDRMIIFGGFCRWCTGDYWFNDTWELSFGDTPQWSQLPVVPPSLRGFGCAIYDPVRERMIVFGGELGVPDNPAHIALTNEVWALSMGATPQWTQLSPTGTPPSARYYPRAIYDPLRDRMVVFGGNDDVGTNNDVWALSLGDAPEWTQLNPSGLLPLARSACTAIYDSVRDRMVVFGGSHGSYQGLNDVWALSLGGAPEWTQLAPAGAPPSPRFIHGASYDPLRDRMLVLWGQTSDGVENDAWALNWGTYATLQCPADMTVPAFSSISSVSMVGFRITNASTFPCAFDYSVSAVGPAALVDKGNPLSLAGTTPVLAPGATYYPPEAGLVIPEIRDYSEEHVTYHVADAANSFCTSVIVMTPPVPTLVTAFDATAAAGSVKLSWNIFSDEEVAGFRVYRGRAGDATPHEVVSAGLIAADARAFMDKSVLGGETYRYALGVVLADRSEVRSPIVTVKATALALALDQNVPNPFNPTTTISFVLPARARVTLSIYDVEGRRVRTLADESLGEGRHEFRWDGSNAAGSPVSSGLYFYRLKVDKETLTKKMVLLK